MRILRIAINGQLISWEVECIYGYDSIKVRAFTGENLSEQNTEGLRIDDIHPLVGSIVDVYAAIGSGGDYMLESLGKYLLCGVLNTLSTRDETPSYFIQLKHHYEAPYILKL